MGKYKYIIYKAYPNKSEEGEFWAWNLKHAYKKICKLAENKFFELCRK